MHKIIGMMLIASLFFIVPLAGCSGLYPEANGEQNGQNNPPEAPRPVTVPPPMPKLPESIPSEERAITYYLVDEGDLPGLGMQLPRELTAQEKDKVIQIALDTEPISDMINQGYTHSTKPVWMSYNKNSNPRWHIFSYSLKDEATQVKADTTFFPSIEIGLGTPQQFVVDIAVDSNTGRAVYAMRRPDKHSRYPRAEPVALFTGQASLDLNPGPPAISHTQ
jgi:hypothetical protein